LSKRAAGDFSFKAGVHKKKEKTKNRSRTNRGEAWAKEVNLPGISPQGAQKSGRNKGRKQKNGEVDGWSRRATL